MLYDILMNRRSIRSFTERPVSEEIIRKLEGSALLSPSSRNIRPWRFITIDDRRLLSRLSECKPHGAGFLTTAQLAIAVLADPTASDVWVEDTAVAAAILLLAAHDLGLGACWCQVRKRMHGDDLSADDYVKQILEIPAPHTVASIIGFGYPASPAPPYEETGLRFDKLSRNRFGEPR